MQRAADPNLQSQLSSYLQTAGSAISEASKRGGSVLATGLEVGSSTIKRDLGYDVGDLGAHAVRSAVSGTRGAYRPLEAENGWGVPSADAQEAGYADGGLDPHNDDFFHSQLGSSTSTDATGQSAGYGTNAPRMNAYRDTAPSSTGAAEDPWAQMAPQSAARKAAAAPQPAPAPGAAGKKKDDDWEEW